MDDVGQPGDAEGVDDHVADHHRPHRREHLAVVALRGQPATDRCGDDEAEEVAAGGSGGHRPPMGVVGVPRDADHAERHVERHGQSAALPAEGRAGDEDAEGLTGDRHRGEGQVDVDLCKQAHEQGCTSDEGDIREDRARDQVSEDSTLRGDGEGDWAGHQGRLLSGSWTHTIGQAGTVGDHRRST